jgi:putative oxidoreductase
MKQLCKWAQQYGPLIGRLMLANIFLISGFQKIGGFAGTAGYMAAEMTSVDPSLIKLMLVATIIIELGGGLMILLGWQARWGATALFLWMLPVTYIFHAYWGLPPDQMMPQFINFHKNLAMMGGMLYIIAFGSGPYSLARENC